MSGFQFRPSPSTPLQTRLPLQFVIIGGGISGLASAIGLRRVGHNVLVLESETDIYHVRRTTMLLARSRAHVQLWSRNLNTPEG